MKTNHILDTATWRKILKGEEKIWGFFIENQDI